MKANTGTFVLLLVASSVVLTGCSTTESRYSSALTLEPPCPVCETGFFTQTEWNQYNAQQSTVSSPVVGNTGIETPESDCPVCDTGFITETEWQAHVELNQTTASDGETGNSQASESGCCCECQAKVEADTEFERHITYVY